MVSHPNPDPGPASPNPDPGPASPNPGPAGPAGRTARARRGYWLPGLIALAALLLIGLVVGAGDLDHQGPKQLSGADIDSDLALGIQTEQHYSSPPEVSCPGQEPVRQGWQFTCAETRDGVTVKLRVTEVDGRGRLSWQIQSGP